jgi:hypothetical protein
MKKRIPFNRCPFFFVEKLQVPFDIIPENRMKTDINKHHANLFFKKLLPLFCFRLNLNK